MSSVEIKFHNTKNFLFTNKGGDENLISQDFKPYILKNMTHRIDILENHNQIFCSLFVDKVNYVLDPT